MGRGFCGGGELFKELAAWVRENGLLLGNSELEEESLSDRGSQAE